MEGASYRDEERDCVRQTLAREKASGPTNTRKSYEGRQRDLMRWCQTLVLNPGDEITRFQVTGKKLNMFRLAR
ncbi:TPA: hypothetical protein N0F65_004964 [Lagenidium giganteum]|uniref:Uncharacterized protein n=1 Tax=Lagenidium giganteum TaxID=4803 RepID=A0AAV2YGS1_9STRA|nr:TPA: hypothetical protein N0F65_004964 [Lagenidium giganteum]